MNLLKKIRTFSSNLFNPKKSRSMELQKKESLPSKHIESLLPIPFVITENLLSKDPSTENISLQKQFEKDTENNNYKSISLDNAIVNAAQNLLLSEKRILMLAITEAVSNDASQNKNKPIRLMAKTFYKTYKLERQTAYEQMKNACHSLLKKYVSWYEKHPKGIQKIEMNWLTSARYAPKEGFIEIAFTPDIKKYLFELTENFTTYRLEQAKALRSMYSWRLLEILSQFKNTGWRQIDLSDLLRAMDATQYASKSFTHIRRRIIEPAVQELNKKEELEIEWSAIKKGKKVISILFTFKKEVRIKNT